MAQAVDDDLLGRDIFELLGLAHLSDDKKAEMFDKIMATLRNRVTARLFQMLSDEETQQVSDMAKKNDQEQLITFLQARSIDLTELMFQEAVNYKQELVELAKPFLRHKSTGQPADK